VVKPKDVKKFHLESTLVSHPVESAKSADLILVLQDISNRYTRETIERGIQKLLCYHAFDIPSILVLNKLDLPSKKDRDIYGLIKKLTCGYLGGVKQVTSSPKSNSPNPKYLDSYLQRKRKEFEKLSSKTQAETKPESEDILKITNYTDFFRALESNRIDDKLVTQLTNGLVGWPGFNEVFAVSALENKGVDDLRKYLFAQAKDSSWLYHPKIKIELSPQELVLSVIKSKCLEVFQGDIGYNLKPQIGEWKVENGVLRLNIQFVVRPAFEKILLYDSGSGLKSIAKLSEFDLQDFFQTPVFVIISVHSNITSLKNKN